MRPKIARLGGVLAVGVALTVGLAACGGGGDTGSTTGGGDSAAPTTLKIGFMGDLSGESSGIVIPPSNGAQLAVDEYNATNPKVKIEMIKYDSRADATTAVNLAQKAIKDDKVVALVGPAFSGESKQAVPVLEEAKIPNISASATNVDLAKNGWKYWHRVVPNDGVQGPSIADFIAGAAAAKNVFVVDDKSEYGKGLADAVRAQLKTKGATVSDDALDPNATDYSSTVNKAVSAKPDAIFFGGYYAGAGKLLKQLRDKGVQAKFFSGDGSLDKGIIESAGAAQAEGALIGCPCRIPTSAETDEKVKKFAADYKAKFGADPLIYATEGYDAMTAFTKAIAGGATTADAINEAVGKSDFDGISKHISFDPTGEPSAKSIYMYQVKDGQIGLLGDTTTAKLS
ncbi:branched chain amino acid ABC transporter substrate-binding protein [Sphaerisporangium melleum]|uniref:Branched chain amino acid ABC transporter substrate-binding protein n=1 Tax=Sphaerisporangium melleum TaxID=321316 RepID=A0A917VR36_9ACTN|nr:branched-chain amino acid ABC transporter substrate-binding protein [Sphaerisporangium melleum]GGL10295.1 branched chain amino acid ABC transporter substrate-binding protein [Sphaerisporangium melleum]GII70753.1 branched chain amino acid ABC transporter substrate-binding protein [Sphaerisporangium melleum]